MQPKTKMKTSATWNNESSHRATLRLLALLEAMTKANDGMTLAALSTTLEVPKSSLLLLLRPLVASAYLAHDKGAYRLGPTIFRLSAEILATRSLPKRIRPCMEKLAVECRESVFLCVLDREQQRVVHVEMIDSPQLVRYSAPVGTSRPLYCSAAGRLLLAYQDDDWIEKYVRETPLQSLTKRSMTSKRQLRETLKDIRRTGISVNIEGAVPGAAGVAAPVLDADGHIVAALLVGAPSERFEKELPLLRKLVKNAADEVSNSIAEGSRF